MPDFISDYLDYNSGNECPQFYHLWSAFSLLAVAAGRSISIRLGGADGYGELVIPPELQICLVGLQGSRKTFAKDVAMNIAMECLNVPLAASVDTARGITKVLSSDDCLRVYTDHTGTLIEYRPLFLAIDELKNFLSADPIRLVDLFVGIYGRRIYKHHTAHHGSDEIINPCVNILACATTEYIVDQLRERILSGGLARRMLFVCSHEQVVRKGDPKIPQGGREKLERAKKHLAHISEKVCGEFRWQSEEEFHQYIRWYEVARTVEDPLMQGFENSKHIQAYKLAMLLALAEYDIKLVITWEKFQRALRYIAEIEPGMQKLFLGAGRNVLAAPMLRMLEAIKEASLAVNGDTYKGIVHDKKLQQLTEKDLTPSEYIMLLNHLKSSDQITIEAQKINGVERRYVMLKETKESIMKKLSPVRNPNQT